MRKLFCCCLVLMLLSAAALPVSAEGHTYQIPELDMTIEIPSSYDVFTLDMDEDDPLYAKYDCTKTELDALLVQNNIVLYLVNDASGREITFVREIFDTADTIDTSEDGLLAFAAALEERQRGASWHITGYDVYNHSQLTFLRLFIHDTDKGMYGLQYYAVYNQKIAKITLQSPTNIKVSDEKQIQQIIESISLTQSVPVTTVPADTIPKENLRYTDPDTGVTLQMPGYWRAVLDTDMGMDIKFVNETPEGNSIWYGSFDFWGDTPQIRQMGYSRADVDRFLGTEGGLSSIIGNDVATESVTYGGQTYIQVELEAGAQISGITVPLEMTMLIKIHNGWYYLFFFSGTKNAPDYADFVEMVSSASYPAVETNEDALIKAVALGAVSAVVIVTAVLLVFLFRNRKRKRQDAVPAAPARQPILFCRECGKRLDANSRFCSECGTQVVEVRREEK